jgi:ribosomal protein L16 Arg81 hydroxylase
MSVIVRQVDGVKHWRLQQPPTPWPRGLPTPGAVTDGPTIAELDLRPGESLFVPRGVVHDAWTTDSASLHITFSGDAPVTWTDLLHELVDQIADTDPNLRAALPWRFADDPDHLTDVAAHTVDRFRTALADHDPARLATTVLTRHSHTPERAPRGLITNLVRATS